MLTSVGAIRLAARHLAGGAFITLLAGCAGDDLLLPKDGAPERLRIFSGDQQSAPAGESVANPLVVETLDVAGRPVPGAVIIFAFVDLPIGAEVEPANTETDETGRAAAEVTLGTPAGHQNVEARLDDPASDLKVQFRLTAIQPPGGGDDDDGDEGDGGGDEGDDGGGDEGDGGGGDEGDGDGGGEGDDGGGGGGGGGNGGGAGPDDGAGDGDSGGNEGSGGGDDDDDDSGNGKDKDKGKGKGKGR
jgi:hypothetical protein